MTLGFAFFTFLNAFWVMLFIAAPFSTQHDAHDQYKAAPSHIDWKKALVIATVLALLVTLALALIIKSGIVGVRNG